METWMRAKETLIIGHRGAGSLAPENTLAGARAAAAAGAHGWEFDVRATADGVPVLIHDEGLERTSDAARRPELAARRPWPVSEFTLAELRSLDFVSWFRPRESGPEGEAGPQHFAVECAPTLAEALRYSRQARLLVNVEIKDAGGAGEEFAERAARLAYENMPSGEVLVSSFNPAYVRRAKQAVPGLLTGILTDYILSDPAAILADTGADAWHPHYSLVDPGQAADVIGRGYMVNLWTINDEETAEAFRAAGATSIITDDPSRLIRS